MTEESLNEKRKISGDFTLWLYGRSIYIQAAGLGGIFNPFGMELKIKNVNIAPRKVFDSFCKKFKAWLDNNYEHVRLSDTIVLRLCSYLAERGDGVARDVLTKKLVAILNTGELKTIEAVIVNGYVNQMHQDALQSYLETAFEFNETEIILLLIMKDALKGIDKKKVSHHLVDFLGNMGDSENTVFELLNRGYIHDLVTPEDYERISQSFDFIDFGSTRYFVWDESVIIPRWRLGSEEFAELMSPLEPRSRYIDVKIDGLPDSITSRRNLKRLVMESLDVNEIPAAIENMQSLQQLVLPSCAIRSVAPQIGKLGSLRYLDLKMNPLESIPAELGNARDIEFLDLSMGKLKEVPPELGRLHQLKYLDLSYNEIASIPEELGGLESLEALHLSHNPLSALPETIGNLNNLRFLGLENCRLEKLPLSIGQLSNLREIELKENLLSELPDTLNSMSSLEMLNIEGNNLARLPPSINGMISIKQLLAGRNQIREFHEFTYFPQLETLCLEHNLLNSIPRAVGTLLSLKKLSLRNNKLESLPESITYLKQLESIDVENNRYLKCTDPLLDWFRALKRQGCRVVGKKITRLLRT